MSAVRTMRFRGMVAGCLMLSAGAAHGQETTNPDAVDDVNTPLPSAANIGQESVGALFPEPIRTLNGLRPWLVDRGLQFAITYQGDPMANLAGGIRQGASYMGRLQTTIEFDPQKTTGWGGGLFHVSGYQIHGVGLSQHFVGSLEPVSDLEAVGTTRLYELWFEQRIHPHISVRFGQLGADTEFFLSPYYGIGIGGTFGWPSITTLNLPSGGPAYPLAAPGIRIKFTPTEKLTFLAAIFDGDPAGPGPTNPQYRNQNGVNFRIQDAPLFIAEGQWRYGSADGPLYPGTLRLGGWTHLGKFADERYGIDGLPVSSPAGVGIALQRRANAGLYGVIDQQIFQKPNKKDDGVFAFARAAFAPSDRNLIDFYADGGLGFQGLVPGRPDDQFAFLGALTKISSQARGADFDANFYNATFNPVRTFEALAEATYSAKIASGVLLQPNIQYVIRPGGGILNPATPLSTRAIPNALVVGVRTTIQY